MPESQPAAPAFAGLKVEDEVFLAVEKGPYTNRATVYRRGRVTAVAKKSVTVRAAGVSGRYRTADGGADGRHTSARLVPGTPEVLAALHDQEADLRALADAAARRADEARARTERVIPVVIDWLKGQDHATVRRIVGDNDLMLWAESLACDDKITLAAEDRAALTTK